MELAASGEQLAQLETFVDLLLKWNRVYNLTAIRDRQSMLAYHVLDSLAVLPWLPASGVCLDVGTGAGLPGIPLAVMRPDLDWVLLDSNGKKTRFVQQVVATLGLRQVTVVRTRVEDYHPGFEIAAVISRAYAALADFVATVAHLSHRKTLLISMKTSMADAEIEGLDPAAFTLQSIPLKVPGIAEARSLAIIRQTDTN